MSSNSYTSERDTPSLFDISYDDNIPQRILSDFTVTRNGERVSICVLDDEQEYGKSRGKFSHPIVARGVLSTSNGRTLKVESAPLVEWCIEYSPTDPRLWVRSNDVWYKLTKPAKDYARTHDLARKRFEMCARIYILLSTLEASECSFKGIAHLLYHPYHEMRGYTEREILMERSFILSQFEALDNQHIVNSLFVRDLRAKKSPGPWAKKNSQTPNSNSSTQTFNDSNGTAAINYSSGTTAGPAVGAQNSRHKRDSSANHNSFSNSNNNSNSNSHSQHHHSYSNQHQDRHSIHSNNSNYRSDRDRDRSDFRERADRDRTNDRNSHSNTHSYSQSNSQSRSHSRSRSRSRSRSPDHNSASSPVVINGHGGPARNHMTSSPDVLASAPGYRSGWDPSNQFDEEATQRLLKKADKALGGIMKTRYAYPFKQPVDPEADGCPDYYDRIANPMDYGTIKKRLDPKSDYYRSLPHVVDDVRQVTRNCITYNGYDHEFSKWSINMLQKFESNVRNAEDAELKSRPGSGSGSQKSVGNTGKKRRASDQPGSKSGTGNKKPSKSARKSTSSIGLDSVKSGKSDRGSGSDDLRIDVDPAIHVNVDTDTVAIGASEGDDDVDTGPSKLCVRALSQACDKFQAPNSKYCSPDCGLIVARERIAELNKSGFNPEEYIKSYITKALVHSRS